MFNARGVLHPPNPHTPSILMMFKLHFLVFLLVLTTPVNILWYSLITTVVSKWSNRPVRVASTIVWYLVL